MTPTPTQVFTAKTANGNTANLYALGRHITVAVSGTFDGSTVKVQVSPDEGTTWIDTTTSLTAAGVVEVTYGEGMLLRLNLSSAGAATSINAWVAYRRW